MARISLEVGAAKRRFAQGGAPHSDFQIDKAMSAAPALRLGIDLHSCGHAIVEHDSGRIYADTRDLL